MAENSLRGLTDVLNCTGGSNGFWPFVDDMHGYISGVRDRSRKPPLRRFLTDMDVLMPWEQGCTETAINQTPHIKKPAQGRLFYMARSGGCSECFAQSIALHEWNDIKLRLMAGNPINGFTQYIHVLCPTGALPCRM